MNKWKQKWKQKQNRFKENEQHLKANEPDVLNGKWHAKNKNESDCLWNSNRNDSYHFLGIKSIERSFSTGNLKQFITNTSKSL